MFVLLENEFVLKGKCKYKDEYGNTIVCTRADGGFNALLEFANKDIIAKPNFVEVYIGQEEGIEELSMDLEYRNGATLKGEDAKAAINGYGTVVGRWASMLGDMLFADLSIEQVREINPELQITEEELKKIQYRSLTHYEESRQTIEILKRIKNPNSDFSNVNIPYPLCIIKDRYSGAYSGGEFLAFNLEPYRVYQLPVNAGDIDCENFWNGNNNDFDVNDYVIGKGNTSNEALWNLILLLRNNSNNQP